MYCCSPGGLSRGTAAAASPAAFGRWTLTHNEGRGGAPFGRRGGCCHRPTAGSQRLCPGASASPSPSLHAPARLGRRRGGRRHIELLPEHKWSGDPPAAAAAVAAWGPPAHELVGRAERRPAPRHNQYRVHPS
jgi:hypothetical protein